MIEVPVSKDIFKYKAKVIGNFTARSLGFLTIGIIFVCIIFFGLPESWGFTPKCILSLIPMLLCFLFGFASIQNEAVERILPRIINDNFMCKKYRTKEIKTEKKPTIASVKESKSYRKVK